MELKEWPIDMLFPFIIVYVEDMYEHQSKTTRTFADKMPNFEFPIQDEKIK